MPSGIGRDTSQAVSALNNLTTAFQQFTAIYQQKATADESNFTEQERLLNLVLTALAGNLTVSFTGSPHVTVDGLTIPATVQIGNSQLHVLIDNPTAGPPAVQVVSASSWPLATGAATSALQTTGNTSLAAILAALQGHLITDLPTGAATAGKQDTGNASLALLVTLLQSALTVNLPAGASTAALQTTANNGLASIVTALAGVLTFAPAGLPYARIVTSASATIAAPLVTPVKSGAGMLQRIIVAGTVGAASTLAVYDNTSGTGTPVMTALDLTKLAGITPVAEMGIKLTTGLTVVTVGVSNVLVVYS